MCMQTILALAERPSGTRQAALSSKSDRIRNTTRLHPVAWHLACDRGSMDQLIIIGLAYNPSAAPHNVKPNVSSWPEVCASVRRMRTSRRRHRHSSAWRIEAISEHGRSADPWDVRHLEALAAAANQLERDLGDRSVLCSNKAGEGCTVSINNESEVLTVCLPQSERVRASKICEPWGEAFQQHGGAIGGFTESACVSFDVRKMAVWWRALRGRTPFLTSASDSRLGALVEGKHYASRFQKKQKDAAIVASRVHAVGQLLNLSLSASQRAAASLLAQVSSAAASRAPAHKLPPRTAGVGADAAGEAAYAAGPWQPRMFGRCAVVGSGHDVKCSAQPHGLDIDAADAVFRSNAAQPSTPSHPQLFYGSHQDPSVAAVVRGYLKLNTIDPGRAGMRTSFRTNCLFGSRAVSTEEVCIVPREWWQHGWDREMQSNNRHGCCDFRRMSSSYRTALLLNQTRSAPYPFSFFVGVESGEPAVDAMMRSSGGNTIHAAISLCEHVELYGTGLHSHGAHTPPSPARCVSCGRVPISMPASPSNLPVPTERHAQCACCRRTRRQDVHPLLRRVAGALPRARVGPRQPPSEGPVQGPQARERRLPHVEEGPHPNRGAAARDARPRHRALGAVNCQVRPREEREGVSTHPMSRVMSGTRERVRRHQETGKCFTSAAKAVCKRARWRVVMSEPRVFGAPELVFPPHPPSACCVSCLNSAAGGHA